MNPTERVHTLTSLCDDIIADPILKKIFDGTPMPTVKALVSHIVVKTILDPRTRTLQDGEGDPRFSYHPFTIEPK